MFDGFLFPSVSRWPMRSPLPFPCVPDRPYKILLAQVGTVSFSHPLFGVSVLFIYFIYYLSLLQGIHTRVSPTEGGALAPSPPR